MNKRIRRQKKQKQILNLLALSFGIELKQISLVKVE